MNTNDLINKDIKKQRSTVQLSKGVAPATVEQERERMINGIKLEIDELWDSWLKSKGTKIKRSEKGTSTDEVDGHGNEIFEMGSEVTVTTEINNGDVQYLVAINRLRERLAKLIGADAPEKLESKNIHVVNEEQILEFEKQLKVGGKENS